MKALTKFICAALIFSCVMSFAGCKDKSKEHYEQAEECFKHSDFDTAKVLLHSIPEDYDETKLYLDALKAIDAYEDGDWLNAVRAFDSIRERWDDDYKNGVRFSYGFMAIDYVYPLRDKMLEMNETNGATFIKEKFSPFGRYYEQAYSSGFENFPDDMLFECLYLYYNQQAKQSADLGKLADYPLTKESPYLEKWADYRAQKLKESFGEYDELIDFYAKTDATTSPIDVTGTCLYVHLADMNPGGAMFSGSRQAAGINLDLTSVMPTFSLPETPEDIRYVLNITQNYKEHGQYTDGSTAYVTESTVFIKDVKTGQILFSKCYSAYPKQTVFESEKRVGVNDFGPESDAFTKDILPELKKLFPVLE